MAIQISGTTVIDDSRNLTNLGTISAGGSVGTAGQILSSTGAGIAWIALDGAGRLLRAPQILTSGTSYTTPAGCTGILVEVLGAGGGGGAQTNNGTGQRASAGGGAGGYAAKFFTVTASTAYTYAIGAGGTTGAAGGSTTFTVGATTLTATGGGGGASATGSTSTVITTPGSGGSGSNGDINAGGDAGEYGLSVYATGNFQLSGSGGSSFFASGGQGRTDGFTTGRSGGIGAGGGGVSGGGGNVNGGAGGTGLIRIWEFS